MNRIDEAYKEITHISFIERVYTEKSVRGIITIKGLTVNNADIAEIAVITNKHGLRLFMEIIRGRMKITIS